MNLTELDALIAEIEQSLAESDSPPPWKYEDAFGYDSLKDANGSEVIWGSREDGVWGTLDGPFIAAAPERLQRCLVFLKQLRDILKAN